MNCRSGELAVLVATGGEPGAEVYLGRIVLCKYLWEVTGIHWSIDPPVGMFDLIRDDCLHPIRDTDGQDETLRDDYLRKPTVEPVPQPETVTSWWRS